MSDIEPQLSKQEQDIIKKRIMLKATIFALKIVVATILLGLILLSFIK